jgi:hypothetical protein
MVFLGGMLCIATRTLVSQALHAPSVLTTIWAWENNPTDRGIAVLAHRSEMRHALIVCPARLVLQWRRQIRLWAPELAISTIVGLAEQRRAAWRRDAVLFLTSYEVLCRDLTIRGEDGPGKRDWDAAVIDEAQRIKNPKADVSIAVKRLRRRRSWALTGTPMENRIEELVENFPDLALRLARWRSGFAGCCRRSSAAVARMFCAICRQNLLDCNPRSYRPQRRAIAGRRRRVWSGCAPWAPSCG